MDFHLILFTDAPQFRHKIASVQVDLGATATLACDVDGNPPPEITWTHEITRKVRFIQRKDGIKDQQ